jgi:hypothetical protein
MAMRVSPFLQRRVVHVASLVLAARSSQCADGVDSTQAGYPDRTSQAPAAAAAALPARAAPAPYREPACPETGLPLGGEQPIERWPYLQRVTATSASVLFTTHETVARATLHVALPGGAARDVPSEVDPADDTGRQRVAVLTGLEPATVYCYRVEDWTAPIRFRTAPAPGSSRPVRFVVLGDSGGASRELVRDGMAGQPFDLMLHVGDIAYTRGTLAEFEEKFFATYADLLARVPMFPASGNHEYGTADAAPYRQVFALPEKRAAAARARPCRQGDRLDEHRPPIDASLRAVIPIPRRHRLASARRLDHAFARMLANCSANRSGLGGRE